MLRSLEEGIRFNTLTASIQFLSYGVVHLDMGRTLADGRAQQHFKWQVHLFVKCPPLSPKGLSLMEEVQSVLWLI